MSDLHTKRTARSRPSTAPGAVPTKCRWCDVVRDIRGISGHERFTHPTQYYAAKRDIQPKSFTPKVTPPAKPVAAPDKVRASTSRSKTRPPDLWLDSLLARIERDKATSTGREMYERADARTPAERDRMRTANPRWFGTYGERRGG